MEASIVDKPENLYWIKFKRENGQWSLFLSHCQKEQNLDQDMEKVKGLTLLSR